VAEGFGELLFIPKFPRFLISVVHPDVQIIVVNLIQLPVVIGLRSG
jgi:hypothetical protein